MQESGTAIDGSNAIAPPEVKWARCLRSRKRLAPSDGCAVFRSSGSLSDRTPCMDTSRAARPLRRVDRLLHALRPFGDASDDELETKVECFRDRRIVLADVIADIIEVAERFLGVDNLHGRRNLSNAALTCSSVAKRPSCASFRPRSIPASSSGVA